MNFGKKNIERIFQDELENIQKRFFASIKKYNPVDWEFSSFFASRDFIIQANRI